MAKISSFRELVVWQVSMEVVVDCYALTTRFPTEERYGLARDARRSAVSIPSNIAEGHNRHSARAYLNHVNIALGSQAELDTQIELAVRLGYVSISDAAPCQQKLARVGQMLHGLQRSLAPIGVRLCLSLALLCCLLLHAGS